ncbi:MAG: IclR family transcriptional regulator [Burkholderiaceae bacterium]
MERNVPKIKKRSVVSPTPLRRSAASRRSAITHEVPGAEELRQQHAAHRSLEVLRWIAQSPGAVALAEIASALQLPKSTVHRICVQLTAQHYLTHSSHEKTFSVGPALRTLAFNTLNNSVLRSLRHQVLAELVHDVGETCNLTTLDGAEVLYLDRVEARWPLRLSLEVGSRVPIHCTASGKLFLALSPSTTRQTILDTVALEKYTTNTIVSKRKLENALVEIQRHGYSIDAEEFIPGLIALAVPIFGPEGSLQAALAIHAPTSRVPLKNIMNWLAPLQAAATQMKKLL